MARRRSTKVKVKKKPKKKNWLYYMNYKNLSAEIQQYGYVFSMQKAAMAVVIELLLAAAFGYLYKLHIGYTIIIAIAGLIAVPQLILHTYYNMYEQRRFSDAGIYMEQMLYSFNMKKNILESLKDVVTLFSAGPMHDAIEFAINEITFNYEVTDVEEKALRSIEEKYYNKQLIRLHNFMLKVRNYGGDFKESTQVLIKDRQLWENRIIEHQKDRQYRRRNAIICTVLAPLICVFPLYLLPDDIDISGLPITQISATVFIIICIILFVKVDKKMTINWLDYEKHKSDEEIKQEYIKYKNYDIMEEFKAGLKYLIFPVIVVVFATIFSAQQGSISGIAKLLFGIAVFSTVFILFSPLTGRKILRKNIIKEIDMAFTEWMIEIALLLQTENVHNAISKSRKDAPAVLQIPLEELEKELEENPTRPEPYDNFLKEFRITEVEKLMHLLFSYSEGKGGDSSTQIRHLLESSTSLRDKAEREHNKDMLAGIAMYTYYPNLFGMFKILIDMTVFCALFFSQTG